MTHSCDHILDFIITYHCKTLHNFNLKHSSLSDTSNFLVHSLCFTVVLLPHHRCMDSSTLLLFLTPVSPRMVLIQLKFYMPCMYPQQPCSPGLALAECHLLSWEINQLHDSLHIYVRIYVCVLYTYTTVVILNFGCSLKSPRKL